MEDQVVTETAPITEESVTEMRPTSDQEKTEQIQEDLKLREIELGYRLLSDTKWGALRVYKDTASWVKQAGDDAYYKTRMRLLRDKDYPTNKEIGDALKERGIWTDDSDKEIEETIKKIEEIEKQQEKAKGNKAKDLLASRQAAYTKFFELIAQKESLFGETVETRAEAERRLALIVTAVRKDEEDKRGPQLAKLFTSTEDFMELPEADQDFIRLECNKFWTNIDLGGESFFGASPEGATSSSDGQ